MKRIYLMAALLAAPMLHGQGSQLPKYAVANLPSATAYPTYTVQVIDGSTANTCTVGGGAFNVICVASSGIWVPVSSPNLSFHNILSGTNSSADMTVSTGAAIDYSGTGFIRANHIDGTISAGTGVSISGSGNTGSPYVISASGGGGSVNVNGSSVSSPNFNGATPAAPAGATNKTFQVSGSNVSAYDYGVQYSPTTTQSFFITDSRGITSTDSFNGVGNWTATAFSCDGTTCTATVASDSFTGTSDWALIDFTTHSPTCLTAALVPVTVVNSTHFTFPESYTYCSGVTSGTGGTGNYATNMLQPLTSKQPFFLNHGTTKQLLIQSTGGGSVALYNTNFSTAITPSVSACVSGGGPCYVFVSLGFDDLYATPCSTVATLEGTVGTAGSYRKLFNDLHQLGGAVKVVAVTESTRLTAGVTCSSNSQFTMSAVNQFQASLVGVGAATGGSLDYADYVIDAATALGNMDSGNFIDGIHYSNSGNAVFAQAMNNGLAAQGSFNLGASANNGPNLLHGEQMTTLGASTGNGVIQSYGHSGSLTRDFYLQNDVGQPEFYGNSGNLAMVWRWNSGTSAMWDTIPNNAGFCFYNGTSSAASIDTCMWRDSAGVIDIGNTTKQDASGGLKVTNITVTGTCTGCTTAPAFSAITSSTNTSAAMVVGNGASLRPTGTGAVQATDISGLVAGSSPITVTGLGTAASPFSVTCPTCGTSSGGTNVSQNSGSTETNLAVTGYMPQVCSDVSASGTAQSCTVANTFTPQTGNCVVYKTTTTNSGTGLTVNINSLGAKSVAVAGASGWTTTLTASLSIPANKPMNLCYDGTNWDASGTGYLPSSGSGAITNVTSALTPTNCTITGNLCATAGAVANVTLAAIPGGHNNLRIVMYGGGSAATIQWVQVQFNGDTGTNYDYIASTASNGNAAPIRTAAQNSATAYACNLSATTYAGGGEMRIAGYTGTTFYKNVRGVCGADGPTAAFSETGDWNLTWKGTPAAITSVKLIPQSGNFVTGTTFIVYAED